MRDFVGIPQYLTPVLKSRTHVCAISGGALFGNFYVLKKVPRLSVRERTLIRHRDSDSF